MIDGKLWHWGLIILGTYMATDVGAYETSASFVNPQA